MWSQACLPESLERCMFDKLHEIIHKAISSRQVSWWLNKALNEDTTHFKTVHNDYNNRVQGLSHKKTPKTLNTVITSKQL